MMFLHLYAALFMAYIFVTGESSSVALKLKGAIFINPIFINHWE